MLGTQEAVFRFADVEVREREFRLIKAGEVVPVEPKAFRVLLFLLQNPQKLITKEELLNAVWGETAVSENSLTRSIALLRRLLGEDTHVPKFIETVATVGYRFVCPVEVSEDTHGGPRSTNSAGVASASEAAPFGNEIAVAPVAYARSSRRRMWIILASSVAVSLLVAAVWYLRRPLPPPRINEEFVQITHDGHAGVVIGTDGSRLYIAQGSPFSITQVGIASGDIVKVPVALPNPLLTAVSPDGSALLVDSWADGGLWSFQITGGALRRLVSDGLYGNWSPDGKSLISANMDGEIRATRSDGTEGRILVPAKTLGERPFARYFAWSPDGTKIRFSANSANNGGSLFEMSSEGSGLHELLPGWHPSSWRCCGTWTPDGRFYLFLSGSSRFSLANYGGQIWVLDERHELFRHAPSEPIQLTSGPIRWFLPILSKDGKKIFNTGNILRGELVRYDAKSRQLQPFLAGMSAEGVAFSPDGKLIAYVTYPEGILWRANRDGSNPIQLTGLPWYPTLPRWSPDGAQILFHSPDADGRGSKAYVISSMGGTPHRLLPEEEDAQEDLSWSPDGNNVAFCSGSGYRNPKSRIRILDLNSHLVSILSGSQGMYSPRWSPNGRLILALDTMSDVLKVFDFQTQRWSVLTDYGVGWLAFSRDGLFIYFTRSGDDPGVYRIRTSGGESRARC